MNETTNPYAPFFDDAGHRMPFADETSRIPDEALKSLIDAKFRIAYDETMDQVCISHPYLYQALDPDMGPAWPFYVDDDWMYLESDASEGRAVLYIDHPDFAGPALDAMFELYKDSRSNMNRGA